MLIAWVLLAMLWMPVPVRAQIGPKGTPQRDGSATPGLVLTPTFSAAVGYNDNILYTASDHVDDIFSGFIGGIQASYQPGRRFSLAGAYSFESQIFRRQTNLNDALARQNASLGMEARLTRSTTLSAALGYAVSQWASDLIPNTGLELGRRRAEGYDASLGLERRMGASDTVGLEYSYHALLYAADDADAHQGSLNWTHNFTPTFSFSVAAGPRYGQDSLSAQGSATLRKAFRRTEVSLGYTRGRNLVPGAIREVESESLNATADRKFSRSFQVSLSAGVYRNFGGGSETRSYLGSGELNYSVNRWLTLEAIYRHSINDGDLALDSPTFRGPQRKIVSNLAAIGFTVAPAFRIR